MALELIRPKDLNAAASVGESDSIAVDSGSAVEKATPKQIVDAGRPFATEAQAITGTDSLSAMTPLTTKQAIDASLEPVKATVEAITSGQSFKAASQTNVDVAAANLETGSVFDMAGLSYKLDATATVAGGAPFDGAVYFTFDYGVTFNSRSEAEAANVDTAVRAISLFDGVAKLDYVRDAAGTALTTADGATWSPAGEPLRKHFETGSGGAADFRDFTLSSGYSGISNGQRFGVWGKDEINGIGGIALEDIVDETNKRTVFQIKRTVSDHATASFIDPEFGEFPMPHCMNLIYKSYGERGADDRGARLIAVSGDDESDQSMTLGNWSLKVGGPFKHTGWCGVYEMYDTSTSDVLIPGGDPDKDPTADTIGANVTFIGLEINGKMKRDTIGVGIQILPATYGAVVAAHGRPTWDRCIVIHPAKDGSAVPGSYLEGKTGANIEKMIDLSSINPTKIGGTDPNIAKSNYGLWSRVPFEKAAIALPLTDRMVFDNDATTVNQLQIYGASEGVLAASVNGGDDNVAEMTARRLRVRNTITLDTEDTSPTNRPLEWATNGSLRFSMRADNSSESGSNAGSTLRLYSYADDGTTSTQIFNVTRSTGIINFVGKTRAQGMPTYATEAAALADSALASHTLFRVTGSNVVMIKP